MHSSWLGAALRLYITSTSEKVSLPSVQLVVLVKDKATDSLCAADLHLFNEDRLRSWGRKKMKTNFSFGDIFWLRVALLHADRSMLQRNRSSWQPGTNKQHWSRHNKQHRDQKNYTDHPQHYFHWTTLIKTTSSFKFSHLRMSTKQKLRYLCIGKNEQSMSNGDSVLADLHFSLPKG